MFRRIKRALSLVVCAFLLITLLPQVPLRAAAATQGTCGENVSWSLEDGTLTISGSGPMDDYSTLENAPWLENYSQITNVVLNGVTNIGSYAFWGCSNLTGVTMWDSVTTIGEGAFSDCSSLTNITMPDSVTDIGSGAFTNCTDLTEITLSENLTTVGPSVFANCTGLTCITIPGNVTVLGGAVFFGCTGLNSVKFLGSAPTINDYCFGNVQANIYYPCGDNTWTDSVKQNYGGTLLWKEHHSFGDYTIVQEATCTEDAIGTGTCIGCGITQTQPIPGTATGHILDENGQCTVCQPGNALVIGTCGLDVLWELDASGTLRISGSGPMDDYTTLESAPWFDYCSQITNVVLNGVTNVGSYAFWGCSNLTGVTMSAGVTTIGEGAFSDCSGLTNITMPNSVTGIGSGAFYSCTGLTNVTLSENLTTIGPSVFANCTGLTGITIPGSVTVLGGAVFFGCTGLNSVTFLGSAPTINDYCFGDVQANIYYPCGDNTWADSVKQNYDGTLTWKVQHSFDENGRCTVCQKGNALYSGTCGSGVRWELDEFGTLYIFGDGDMDDYYSSEPAPWYEYRAQIINVVMEDGVDSIGSSAFEDCCSLTGITLPNGVICIGSEAFYGCSSLTGISIPESVNIIEDGAFYGCSSLNLIAFVGAAPTIEPYAFYDVCATVYYRCDDETWMSVIGNREYGGTITWVEYHLYRDDVIYKDATCEEDAAMTEICERCGSTVTTPYPDTATGHRYTETLTPPTCTEEGFTTKICENCGSTEVVDKVPATGHRFVATEVEASCTGYGFCQYECETCHHCAYDNVTFPTGHSYEETAVPPTCTEEGSTCYTCTTCGDSYTTVTPAAGHQLLTTEVAVSCNSHGFNKNVCEICGYTFYDNVTDPLGHQFENGSCITCGTDDPDHVRVSTIPTISLKYPSLSFEDVIIMNVYYTAEDLQDVVDIGLITCKEKPEVVSLETADAVIPGYYWSEGDRMYYSSTAGIAPKDIGDTIYFAVYARLFDGTVTYTNMIGYSPKTYALNQLTGGSSEMRPLVSAMLSYGAAAQNYFGYKTDDPMNNTMTDEQKALAAAYSDDMIATVTQASGDKLGTFINDKTFSARYTTITFEGAFCINYYFKPTEAVVGDVTMYVWSLEDFEAADVLTKENATRAVTMTLTGSGEYTAVIDGIAAKDLDKAVYVSFIYNDGTTEHCGGVVGYTIGMYCKTQAGKTGALSELAKACAVYGYYAKQLFS